ncbi:MAG: sigma 54-interacting transcriptional regulator [Polyangiales bacterium]
MASVLMAWVGHADLTGASLRPSGWASFGDGPIADALRSRAFDEVVLLWNWADELAERYARWLRERAGAAVFLAPSHIESPTNHAAIYAAAVVAVDTAVARHGEPAPELTFHLSPGTPAMATVWVLLAKGRYKAALLEASREGGVRDVSIPFEIAAEFVPELMRAKDETVAAAAAGVHEGHGFGAILHRSEAMQKLLARARRAAIRSLPVLLLGESGTGKDLLARAVHETSPRARGPFVAVNCGAIPENLREAELFGYRKGAFTGAGSDHRGYIATADGGTLFLDEVGELSSAAQTTLLRFLENGEFRPVGDSTARRADTRLVAATNRDLLREVSDGRFREDLYYRLAVLSLRVPPLRERQGDVGLLVDHALQRVNDEGERVGEPRKTLSPAARRLLLQHPWPGNVRELRATVERAAVWSSGPVIEEGDVADALHSHAGPRNEVVLGRVLGEGFSLQDTLAEVARHYLARALHEADGNKTRAASMLGLASHQTLTNWLQRYNVPE